MDYDDSVEPELVRKTPFFLIRWLQWAVAAIVSLPAIITIFDATKLSSPGAPVVLFVFTLGCCVGIVVLHSPPVFFRLPREGKLATYFALLPLLVLLSAESHRLNAAYDKTPAGIREAALQAQLDKIAAQEKASSE